MLGFSGELMDKPPRGYAGRRIIRLLQRFGCLPSGPCGDASERENARRPCWRFQQDGWKLLQAAGQWCGADGDVESAHGPLDQKQGRGDDTGAQLKRLTTQFAEHTFDSKGQNCQDMCTLSGEAVQFLTDNCLQCATSTHLQFPDAGGGLGAEIHRFPTEDCGSCH